MLTKMNEIKKLFGTMDLLQKIEKSNPEFGLPFGNNWTIEDNIPRTNIYENGHTFKVHTEVPGIGKEDLRVKLQGNYLEINGYRKTNVADLKNIKLKEAQRLSPEVSHYRQKSTLERLKPR